MENGKGRSGNEVGPLHDLSDFVYEGKIIYVYLDIYIYIDIYIYWEIVQDLVVRMEKEGLEMKLDLFTISLILFMKVCLYIYIY